MTMLDVSNYLNDKSNGWLWNELLCDRLSDSKSLEKYGFKVYSQNDEDGIIEEIFRRIGPTNKTFVEFGVQDGIESNGHYLLLKGWNGLWIECDSEYYQRILTGFQGVIEAGALRVAHEFITKDNINRILTDNNIKGEVDLLSIDIDGNDYHVWKEIEVICPRVVVIEYNAKIPPACEWIMPYCEDHMWDGGDKHGASLLALSKLGIEKGYTLVGTSMSGINAFFVRNDCLGDNFVKKEVADLYNPPRDYKKFYVGHPSLYCIKDLPEGRKQLFCGRTDNVLFKSGFHPRENMKSMMHWMSQKKAIVWIKDEQNNIKRIYMELENPACLLNEDEVPRKLKIDVEDETVLECEFRQATKVIELNVSREKMRDDGVVELTIEVDFTWKPCDVKLGEDTRQLGICVKKVEFD